MEVMSSSHFGFINLPAQPSSSLLPPFIGQPQTTQGRTPSSPREMEGPRHGEEPGALISSVDKGPSLTHIRLPVRNKSVSWKAVEILWLFVALIRRFDWNNYYTHFPDEEKWGLPRGCLIRGLLPFLCNSPQLECSQLCADHVPFLFVTDSFEASLNHIVMRVPPPSTGKILT